MFQLKPNEVLIPVKKAKPPVTKEDVMYYYNEMKQRLDEIDLDDEEEESSEKEMQVETSTEEPTVMAAGEEVPLSKVTIHERKKMSKEEENLYWEVYQEFFKKEQEVLSSLLK